MSYKTRSARRVAKKSRRNFFASIIIIVLLLYATISWILPEFIGGVGFIKGFLKDPETTLNEVSVADNPTLAPPVLNIPYEATNSSKIGIKGYATSNSKVKIYLDDRLEDTVEVDLDGTFVVEDIELSIGTNNLYGKTVDEKDNESLPSKTLRVIFDNEKPKLEVTEPNDGKEVTGDKKVKIAGKTDPEAQIYINNSRIIVNSEGNFSQDLPLNDGDNNFTIKAQDSASNSVEVVRRVVFKP